jgi:hypothetical protein
MTMKKANIIVLALLMLLFAPAQAEVYIDGFLQGLYGGRIDEDNPTVTEQTASETRLQLRLESFGDNSEVFARMDFVWDGADSSRYDWELREGYLKFRLGRNIDFKVGRQVLTWGTGDLIFINDVFAKDYRSFFVGRDDQYLKAPQNAVRAAYYNPLGALEVVWSPRFEPNRLPTGRRLSYYSPFSGGIVGMGMGDEFYFDPPLPESKFKNGELATRFNRQIGYFNLALYFYSGYYKNPLGAVSSGPFSPPVPVYPKLRVYGASARGQIWGGILWLEGGYFDSRWDKHGDNPLMPNSSVTGMVGYEKQIAPNLTVNGQWQADYMTDHDKYAAQQEMLGGYVRDEVRHLLTTRITRLLKSETVTLSVFAFYSPTDEDTYVRLLTKYKYTDEVTLALGANIFDGTSEATEFGQFQMNDNIYAKVTYGF